MNTRSSSDTLNLVILQKPEQLYLKRSRQLADFVEKESSSISQFQAALPLNVSAGESTLLVAKQLAFEKRLRNRSAVDGDKRPEASGTPLMDSARGQLFPCSTFPNKENRGIALRDFLNGAEHRLHLGTLANDSLERIRIIGLEQFTPSPLQLLNVNSTVQNDSQLTDVYGFRKEIESAEADGFHAALFLSPAGNHQHLEIRIHL